jgi:hypothetical protein
LWSANFNSALVEFNLAGDLLNNFPVAGWSIFGIAIDPVTGNLLVNSAPNFGRISEINKATGVLTGNSIPMALTGASTALISTLQGGLSIASSGAGVHERWYAEVNLVELTQNNDPTNHGGSDVLSIRRLHLVTNNLSTPPRNGWNEVNLQSAVGATGTLDTSFKTFTNGATLRYKVNDPTNGTNGLPAWVVFNMFGEANIDAYTDLTGIIPGAGILVEHRCLNPVSSPSSPLFLYTTATTGPHPHAGAVSAAAAARLAAVGVDQRDLLHPPVGQQPAAGSQCGRRAPRIPQISARRHLDVGPETVGRVAPG